MSSQSARYYWKPLKFSTDLWLSNRTTVYICGNTLIILDANASTLEDTEKNKYFTIYGKIIKHGRRLSDDLTK